MKKLLLMLFLIMNVASHTYSNNNQGQNTYKPNLPLPDGVYFLCCEDGNLNLYNLVGDLVGSGTDCGGLSGCYKVVLVNSTDALLPNPRNPSGDFILSMINSLKPKSGIPHSGDYGSIQTYYFLSKQVIW